MNINQLKLQIEQKEIQIRKIHLSSNSSEISEHLYNTLILEKAVLKKQLETFNENKLLKNFKRIFSSKKKLICDYWEK